MCGWMHEWMDEQVGGLTDGVGGLLEGLMERRIEHLVINSQVFATP